jgi:hypothetical protein
MRVPVVFDGMGDIVQNGEAERKDMGLSTLGDIESDCAG